MEKQTGDSPIKAVFGRAIQLRRDGKLQDAIALLKTAIEADGDSGELWGELALGQHQLWHQHMTKLHHQDAIKTGGFKEDPLRSSLLQETYNTFIIAMEYPVNKKNPLILVKLVVLYIEFQAYRGALSVCTLLVEGYANSSVIQEAIFLTAVSAKALQKHRESAQYFQHVAEKPPYRLHSYQLHLLAALEFEKVGGMRDHVREAFHQAYKDMIALSPLTPSEKAAHSIYKTSKKNESQRVQLWYQDDSTWFDLGKRLMTLNFPILVCDLLAVARKRKKVFPLEILVMEGIAFQRVGDTNRAIELLTEALQREYWSDYIRCLLRRLSDGWKNQFDLEEQSASTIQCELRKHQLRVKWRDTVRSLVEARRHEMTVKIQCKWRQYKAKSLLANLRHQRHLREVAENEIRSAARSTASISPDKWKVFAKSDGFGQTVKQQQRNLTLEQRAEIPSIVFYTLLNRVRKSGILQLSFSGGLSFTTAQMYELLAFASSVIVDGGGGDAASHLVNQVVDAMETSNACPTHKLMMYNARLDTAHAVKLCHVLKHPRGMLTALILSNVRLTTAGVVAIATALCHGHGRLGQLVLEGCGIGSIGGAALFEALCHNKQLWKLDLSGNHLSDSVCPLLSTALLTNESLQVLSLRANGLSDRGVFTYVAPTLERLCSSGLELLVVSVASVAAHHALQQAASRFAGAIRRPFRVETCDWLKS
ncbi:hypothetical protein Poli38472_003341 [Pythium oligandrum]|uniref:Uncharacterized protein n=1 Tax=Pythium oligandrum TaxID=41045 RepID=A0A8K1C6P5_PYTOL|nr:hypothetical protein Poli38472_003341 [Pythium oligandrum]|eukprot:TMW57416.1 hypothetical protein Poli38472_003341 [Pythium oligandrum]